MLKTFTYGTANSGGDLRKGRVTSASRFNFVLAPFNATVEVRDTYVYAGLGGRTSQRDSQMHFNASPSESFRQTFVWTEIGNLALQSYPVCTAISLCGTSSPRNVTNLYTRGRLTGVPGYASVFLVK